MKIFYNFILISLLTNICSASKINGKDDCCETINDFYISESSRISEVVYESFKESITINGEEMLHGVADALKNPEIYEDNNSNLFNEQLGYVYTSLMPNDLEYYIQKRIFDSKIIENNIKKKYPNSGLFHDNQEEITPDGFLEEMKQLENNDNNLKLLKRFIRDIIIAIIEPIFPENSVEGLHNIFGSDFENIKENNQLEDALKKCIKNYLEENLLKDHMDKIIDLVLKYYK